MTVITLIRNARRSFMTERSERMNEEASYHPGLHIPLSHRTRIFFTTH
nr:hypothetical protein [Erwinia amylovora]